jgi:hypothetical protein
MSPRTYADLASAASPTGTTPTSARITQKNRAIALPHGMDRFFRRGGKIEANEGRMDGRRAALRNVAKLGPFSHK